jgi:hypothetical protein
MEVATFGEGTTYACRTVYDTAYNAGQLALEV